MQEKEIQDFMRKPKHKKRIQIVKTQIVREGSLLYETRRFRNPQEAAELARLFYRYADREIFLVLSVDNKNTPLAIEVVSVGTINQAFAEPREVFKHAILSNATNIICFHNHLSGIVTPSEEDILMTKRLNQVGNIIGIRLLDHIIIGEGEDYYSMQESGQVTNGYVSLENE